MTALINPFWYAGPVTDPHFANVVLLLHCNGAHGSTAALIDSSLFGHNMAQNSGTSLTTAQFKFGSAAVTNSLASANTTAADSNDWNLAAGQFTVEAFVRVTSAITANKTIIGQCSTAAGNLGWYFNFSSTQLRFSYSTNGTSFATAVAGNYVPPLDTWVHVAVDRDASNMVRVYADGVVVGSATVAATIFNSATTLTLANRTGNSTEGFIGQIDEVRITKGVARYGSAFTPPSAPFPNS